MSNEKNVKKEAKDFIVEDKENYMAPNAYIYVLLPSGNSKIVQLKPNWYRLQPIYIYSFPSFIHIFDTLYIYKVLYFKIKKIKKKNKIMLNKIISKKFANK